MTGCLYSVCFVNNNNNKIIIYCHWKCDIILVDAVFENKALILILKPAFSLTNTVQ